MHSLLDLEDREALMGRFRALTPDAPARWGRMNAPRMLAHLTDQMRHTLGDATARPRQGPLRWPIIRELVMYWLPWPRGRVKGPPEAFVTQPGQWSEDLEKFEALVAQFVDGGGRQDWPDHAMFGRMTRQSWGYFCFRHFDYHLKQFGR